MSRVFTHPLRVRYAECDPQGIVFNSRYLEYFDVALTELWRDALGSYEEAMAEAGVDLVVAEVGVRFREPLRFDDMFEMRVKLKQMGETSMSTSISIERGGTSAAVGEMRHVFVERGTANKREIPDRIRAALAPYLAAD